MRILYPGVDLALPKLGMPLEGFAARILGAIALKRSRCASSPSNSAVGGGGGSGAGTAEFASKWRRGDPGV